MRLLRRTVSDPSDSGLEELEALLESAAGDAPPSRRAEEIRARVLEDATRERSGVPGMAPLALAAGALLLALVIGVGAPVVGTFISTLLDRTPAPSIEVPDASSDRDDASPVLEVPMPSDSSIPTREVPALPTPTPQAADDDDRDDDGPPTTHPANPQPSAAPPADPSPTPDETWPPEGPPVVVPTPPATGPPPGTPGG